MKLYKNVISELIELNILIKYCSNQNCKVFYINDDIEYFKKYSNVKILETKNNKKYIYKYMLIVDFSNINLLDADEIKHLIKLEIIFESNLKNIFYLEKCFIKVFNEYENVEILERLELNIYDLNFVLLVDF